MTDTERKERFLKARKALIEREFAGLNDMQKQAVMATEGPLLLLAGAGSGKTTVLIRRIENLIRFGRASDTDEVRDNLTDEDVRKLEAALKSDGELSEDVRSLCAVEPAAPWRILAITFTNKAAGELRSRLSARLGPDAEQIWAQTFHSACVRILRRSGEALGIPKSFAIYDTSDSQAVMKRILKDLSADEKTFPPRAVLSDISRAKDAMLSPEEYAAAAEREHNPRKKLVAQAYAEYRRRLRAADALDFDDLILCAVKLLEEDAETRAYYQRLFRYVLVDEYQDTSRIQYRLASLLAGNPSNTGSDNICVVGDDDQSIYRFRGATIENILQFEERYKNARCIKLEQNYRSTGHILGAANAVISHNRERKGKNLWTGAGDGEPLRFFTAEGEDGEASYIASRIREGVQNGMSWGDFAVLYRMNAQSNRLEFAMKQCGIPYKIVGGTRFFDRAEIKDVTSYLAVIHNPADDLRLLRIVNTPPRGIGPTTVERMQELAAREGRSLFYILSHSGDYPELKNANGRLQAFYSLLYELHEALNTMPLDEFYDHLLDKTGYVASLGTGDEALSRTDNIMELKSNIVNYMKKSPEPTLGGFLDEIALYTDTDDLPDGESAAVTMMTIHAAKGLEFPWVFVAGMEDGIFPSSRSIGEEEEMEEERRLCYVALTRARERLFLTAARHRMLFGRTSANMVSRFVEEIPEEHMERSEEPNAWGGGGDFSYRERGASYRDRDFEDRTPYPTRSAPSKPKPRPKPVPAPSKPTALPSLAVGDRIRHKAFGEGTVTAFTAMPGDALIAVQFSGGEKRLLLKTAASVIEKIQ